MPAYANFETLASFDQCGDVGLLGLTHAVTDANGLTTYKLQTISIQSEGGVMKASLGDTEIKASANEKA